MTDTLPVDELEPGIEPLPGEPRDPIITPYLLKTWAPYDRLLAGDLNAAFRYASHDNITLPGAYSNTAAAGIAVPVGAGVTVQHGTANIDPLGIRQADGRLRIPIGYAGVWLYTASYEMGVASGTAAGAIGQVLLQVGAEAQTSVAMIPRFYTATAITGATAAVIRNLVDNTYIQAIMRTDTAAGTGCRVTAWSLFMLTRFLGTFGA